ncbi:hypothetical protein GCM10027445_50500 [Amycolatopsis endophytica]|uniref:Uncharacterized protein n=1 Tax=Amycolatopsis endophytica TaxID=860233 RepID=A0A853AZE8_9PSEU|nr:hypothetical protein [Amycolatopsis endophytica]NYI87876.1 hypothetical protein [Amycolatopsis endophytica]
MSARITIGTTPARLKTLAIRRFETTTGRRWREATETQKRTWLADTEPVVRAEEGIATDAVWRGGAWQPAGQADLFSLAGPDETEVPS